MTASYKFAGPPSLAESAPFFLTIDVPKPEPTAENAINLEQVMTPLKNCVEELGNYVRNGLIDTDAQLLRTNLVTAIDTSLKDVAHKRKSYMSGEGSDGGPPSKSGRRADD